MESQHALFSGPDARNFGNVTQLARLRHYTFQATPPLGAKESTRTTESSGHHETRASLSNSDAVLFLSLIRAYVNCPTSPTTRNKSRDRTRTGPSQIVRLAADNPSSLHVTPLQTRFPQLQARHRARITVAMTSSKKIQAQALSTAFHLARERSASRAISARKASSPGVGSSSATTFGR